MMPRAAALALALSVAVPACVVAQAPIPVPAAPVAAPSPDSLARQARADSLARFYLAHPESLPRRSHADSTRLRPAEVVRVPAGQSPVPSRTPTPPAAERPDADRAKAGGGPEQRIRLSGGLGFPVAPPDLTNGWNPGVAFGGSIEYALEPRFSVEFAGEWSMLAFDERRFLRTIGLYGSGSTVEGGAAHLVLVAAAARFHTRSTWPRVYARGGPGYGMVRYSEALLYEPVTSTLYSAGGDTQFKGGMTAGAGVEFVRKDGSGFFADVHWSALFTKGGATQYIPFRVGVLFP